MIRHPRIAPNTSHYGTKYFLAPLLNLKMARDRENGETEDTTDGEIGREMLAEDGVVSVVAHLYRGEVDRTVNWRSRLDSTTNWAVTIIAAILAYAFSGQDVAHSIILVAMVVGLTFLVVETRRFQRYDIWRSRVRSMQENVFATVLEPDAGPEHKDWRRTLSEDYRHPDQQIPFATALAHRLRRVYLPLLGGLLIVWLFRLSGESESFTQAASVSGLSGRIIVGGVVGVYASLVVLALWPSMSIATETSQSDEGAVSRSDSRSHDDPQSDRS